MTTTRGLRILYTLFFLDLGIIAWREIKRGDSAIGWPEPSRFIGLGIAFTMLSVFAEISSPKLAAVIGGGVTLGLVIHTFQSQADTSTTPATQTQTPVTTGTGLTSGIQV